MNEPEDQEDAPTPQAAAVPASVARGNALIADLVKRLPEKPGVYRMMNDKGEVLYVGKAKSLKNRVVAYSRPHGHPTRILRMIASTHSMEFIITETEKEALLLETNLIKRLKPRYNVLMRDDKSLPYILITQDDRAPAIVKHRGARNIKGHYFGPFASTTAVNWTVDTLQKAFLLRTCSDSIYSSRTRPCLLYQIKRCAGPCTNEITKESYAELAKEARDFLSGEAEGLREQLAKEMDQAVALLEYETAAQLRDRIAALAAMRTQQSINTQHIREADIFAICKEADTACIQVFFIRHHQNWGNRSYFPRVDSSMDEAQILQDFMMQFYEDKPCPKLILLSHLPPDQKLLEEAFSEKENHKIEISTPQRGERQDLLQRASINAKEALARKLGESETQTRLLAALAERFMLKQIPERIEVYDNSHIMGTNAVGAMIVAGPDGFIKNQYRKWTIKSEELEPGDDYGMMREVFTRRFTRLMKESQENDETSWPDLILVDGGKGQLEAVRGVLAELGLEEDIELIAIAKGPDRNAGREQFFKVGQEALQLEPRDPVLYFVQRLRDEAHRFVIGAHRQKRAKSMAQTSLDDIPGIGPSRKRALIRHFGTAKAVSDAAFDDLRQVPGISEAMAKQIWGFFHDS